MKTGNVLLGLALTGLAIYGISRMSKGKGSKTTAQQKADEIIKMGGADVQSSFMGMGPTKQTCAEKCADLGFGVLRNDPCYCKQEKSRMDGMTAFMNS